MSFEEWWALKEETNTYTFYAPRQAMEEAWQAAQAEQAAEVAALKEQLETSQQTASKTFASAKQLQMKNLVLERERDELQQESNMHARACAKAIEALNAAEERLRKAGRECDELRQQVEAKDEALRLTIPVILPQRAFFTELASFSGDQEKTAYTKAAQDAQVALQAINAALTPQNPQTSDLSKE